MLTLNKAFKDVTANRGAVFLFGEFCGAVRCSAGYITFRSCGAVRCTFGVCLSYREAQRRLNIVRCGAVRLIPVKTAPHRIRTVAKSSNAERPPHGFCSCDSRSVLFNAEFLELNGGGVVSGREPYGSVRCGRVKGKTIRYQTAP